MQTRATLLLLGLAGALALWIYSRTSGGRAALQSALTGLDIAAARVKGMLVSRGYRNNNPGNLEFIADPARAWNGQVESDGRFGVYARPEDGTRAMGKQLQKYERAGRRTVRDILNAWAPPGENDTGAYATDVAGELNIDPDEPFSVTARLPDLARAIAKHENGYVDDAYNWQWVYLT